MITAIVDEDQLSLAIGRNGQNVRLASQLIGWQIDLYGSREWLERGADTAIFPDAGENYETSDFPLSELELSADALEALGGAGYTTFLQIINLERGEFLAIPGLSIDAVDQIVALIDELTVIEGEEDARPEALADGEHTVG